MIKMIEYKAVKVRQGEYLRVNGMFMRLNRDQWLIKYRYIFFGLFPFTLWMQLESWVNGNVPKTYDRFGDIPDFYSIKKVEV